MAALRPASSFIQHEGKSVDRGRQSHPHGHSINLDRANRFAFAADLGLDKVLIYKFDADKGTLTPNDPAFAKVAPGSGPRHFAFHPNGRFAYVISEMANTVTAFAYDPNYGVADRDPDDLHAACKTSRARATRPRCRFTPQASLYSDRTGAMTASPSSRLIRVRAS